MFVFSRGRGGLPALVVVAALLWPGSAVAQTAPAGSAQCDDGAVSALGAACTTGAGVAGSCLAEMCNVDDDGGASANTVVPCALCYAPGDGPPTLADGSTVVTITTTTTTTDGDGSCSLGGTGTDSGGLLVLLAPLLRRRRRRDHRRAGGDRSRDVSDGGGTGAPNEATAP